MEYALPPLTTCTAYLHVYMCHFHIYTTSLILQDHQVRPCYTVMLIINAQISSVPRLPLSFLLVLTSDRKTAATQFCIYIPIPSLAKQLHKL